MITDKDRLDAPYMPSALLTDIRRRSGGHWGWSNKKALDKIYERDRFIRAESAEQARKEAAERVRKEFGAQEGGSNTIDRVCAAVLGDSVVKENLITDHIPDIGKKLAIAVKALEDENYELNVLWQELKDMPGSRIKELGERVYERNRRVSEIIGTIEREALKEIQG